MHCISDRHISYYMAYNHSAVFNDPSAQKHTLSHPVHKSEATVWNSNIWTETYIYIHSKNWKKFMIQMYDFKRCIICKTQKQNKHFLIWKISHFDMPKKKHLSIKTKIFLSGFWMCVHSTHWLIYDVILLFNGILSLLV